MSPEFDAIGVLGKKSFLVKDTRLFYKAQKEQNYPPPGITVEMLTLFSVGARADFRHLQVVFF